MSANEDRYLSARPKKLNMIREKPVDETKGSTFASLSLLSLLTAVAVFIHVFGVIPGDDPDRSKVINLGVLLGMVTVATGVAAALAMRRKPTGELEPDADSFGHDQQARGLYDRIASVVKYSTAGWDDDLWQAFFTIGYLIDEKKSLTSVTLAGELYDEIEALVGELDEMIGARQALIDDRRRLGMSPKVPGTQAQRIEAGAAEEMEELAMRPLLLQRIDQIKNQGPGELTITSATQVLRGVSGKE